MRAYGFAPAFGSRIPLDRLSTKQLAEALRAVDSGDIVDKAPHESMADYREQITILMFAREMGWL